MDAQDEGIERPPRYLRLAGAILAVWFIGGTLLDASSPGAVRTINVAVAAWGGIAGIGLALGQRWAWFLALGVAGFELLVGALIIVQGPDITNPSSVMVGIYFAVIPGLLLVAALFSARTLRWLRKRPAVITIPARPDPR